MMMNSTLPDGWTCVREQETDHDVMIFAYLRMSCPASGARWEGDKAIVSVHASSLVLLVNADGSLLDWRYRP